MTMRVYIVMFRYVADGYFHPNAVFTTRELAYRYIDQHNGTRYDKSCEFYVDGVFVVDEGIAKR